MDPMITEFLAVVARWAITSAMAYLVTKHVITPDQADSFASDFGRHAVYLIALFAPLAWGLWAKYRSRLKFMAALSMPEKSTENDVNAKLKLGQRVPSVLTPVDTVPGVPK